MSTTICDTTALFTFFLFMRLNINVVTSCDPFIVIFAPSFFIIKAWKSTEEIFPNRPFRDS